MPQVTAAASRTATATRRRSPESRHFFIIGGSASDNITTGDGGDTIDPGSGVTDGDFFNRIHAGGGDDYIYSGDTPNGDDIFEGNIFDGGDGFDTVDYTIAPDEVFAFLKLDVGGRTALGKNGYGGTDYFSANPSNPTGPTIESLLGSAHDDWFVGSDVADFLSGQGGNDLLEGGLGNDTLQGGAGTDDWASYENAAGAVTVDLTLAGDQATGADGTDDLFTIENLRGGASADILTGDGNDNELEGGGAGDTLGGGAGDDTITGGAGMDSISGGADDDDLVVADGDVVAGETYDGGTGTDALYVSGTNDFTGSTVLSIEGLEFGALGRPSVTFTSDQIGGTGVSSTLAVEGDTDPNAIIVNMVSPFTLDLSGWTFTNWTAPSDTITINGSTSADTIVGSSQIDTITGGLGTTADGQPRRRRR